MRRNDRDEVASMLLARILKELEDFTASRQVHADDGSEEIWSRFIEHLRDNKASVLRPTKRLKKAN
jgi:hypothetical protein